MKRSMLLFLLASLLISCTPQTGAAELTATQPAPTQTSLPPPSTATTAALPTETPLPTDPPSPTAPACATPVNPVESATVPAYGPFDFKWTAFTGATSYVISIGPKGWFPTNFPVSGTTLTRYMESFPGNPAYEWSIAAINSAGQEICKAGPFAFAMSVDVSATASFNNSIASVPDADNSSNPSSETDQGANDGAGDNSSGGAANNASLDISIMISGDSDDGQCRLTASFNIKSNHEFVFLRLLYRYDGQPQEEYVDLIAPLPLQPYPAYNLYTATTPSLPVTQGATVSFGVWYKVKIGTESKGVTIIHSMSNCSQ